MTVDLTRLAMTKTDSQTFLSTLLTVALLGFQSQAVIHGKYGLTALTSFSIAFAQYFMIRGAAQNPWRAAVWMGLGGAVGITLAMLLFRGMFL